MTLLRFAFAPALAGLLLTMPIERTAAADPTSEQRAEITAKLSELNAQVEQLKQAGGDQRPVADVEVYAKAADWILRHNEFYRPEYVQQTLKALETGLARARQLAGGETPWLSQPGTTIRGYYSRVDGSVQPYALTLPADFDSDSADRRKLHVKLHGRAAQMNEVNFIHRHDNQSVPESQDWVQLDVFGRTNNAYRWAGETDVFEAIADLRRAVRIDTRRITLWGFSMGGAGAWHLGLHYPSQWSSVGAGAGFVDFYNYQKHTDELPPHQHKTLGIYDAVDYALNAFNVPVITYGGENDPQLLASTTMAEAAKKWDVPIELLVGPGMGHKFDPKSFQEFMAFHQRHAEQGRKPYPGANEIRFITRTLKYNQCEWVTIEEMERMYEPALVTTSVDPATGTLRISTKNVAVLHLARDIASFVDIDGTTLPLAGAADGLLPGVVYEKGARNWVAMDYEDSRKFFRNPDRRKRHNLQGPIDDAFMQPFVCVTGTGTPWSEAHESWAEWTLDRFEREFDQYLRGRVPVVQDTEVDEDLIADKNLILFGDPGSNSVLAKVLPDLPLKWGKQALEINGQTYDPATHGVALIFPNPLNPHRYVVLNSGHTFHAADFKASNAWLFPRLGDVAVQKFTAGPNGEFTSETLWANIFNASWNLSPQGAKTSPETP